MKKLVLVLTAVAAFSGSALAADLPARTYTKAPMMPEPVANWTGFYIFGGAGGGLWAADSNSQSTGAGGVFDFGPASTALTRDQRLGGSGWFGTVGAGYDWQSSGRWVVGLFADGQFGEIRGSLSDPLFGTEGREKLRTSYAAGARLGYLVAPNVLSYVNAGYSGSEWSGTTQTFLSMTPPGAQTTTSSFHRDGFFVGGGVENNLDIFGISMPGLFMKTEYRSAFYDRISLPTTLAPGNVIANGAAGLTGDAITFKPWVQTISTSLVYRFNWTDPVAAKYRSALAADLPARMYTKAPMMPEPVANWTGFYIFGGAGGGLWAADSNAVSTGVPPDFGPAGTALTRDQRLGGSGWFGTVGAGYDWQFNGRWVAGIFADGQFGEIRGSLSDPITPFEGAPTEGREKLRTSYAAGVRLGYLVAPSVLSYVNAGYSGSEWSGTSQTFVDLGNLSILPGVQTTTPSFHRDGFFVGGGVENNLDIFGISMPGLFMKTEYRSAFYDRISLPVTFAPGNAGAGTGPTGTALTFKPTVQTISTSLVYRFNWGGPLVAKY